MFNGERLTMNCEFPKRDVNHSPLTIHHYFDRRLKNSNNLFT